MNGHPETYYDAKRALYAKVAELDYRGYELERSIPAVLVALGWDEPEPAKDPSGKPLKAWRLPVKGVLPSDVHQRLADQSHERAKAARRRWDFEPRGVVIAPTKTAAIDLVHGPDRKKWSRPKTTEVSEVDPTDLSYEVAVAHPDTLMVITSVTEHELVPLADLKTAQTA